MNPVDTKYLSKRITEYLITLGFIARYFRHSFPAPSRSTPGDNEYQCLYPQDVIIEEPKSIETSFTLDSNNPEDNQYYFALCLLICSLVTLNPCAFTCSVVAFFFAYKVTLCCCLCVSVSKGSQGIGGQD